MHSKISKSKELDKIRNDFIKALQAILLSIVTIILIMVIGMNLERNDCHYLSKVTNGKLYK